MRLGRGGVGDVGGVDLAKNGEPADERDALGFVHLDAAEHDGVVTHVDLGREHGLIAAEAIKPMPAAISPPATANIEFSKWVTVFGDDKMAAAVVDRLVYTGRLVEFNGASCRIESRVLCCLLALPGH